MPHQIPPPPPPPPREILGKRGKKMLALLALVIIVGAFFVVVFARNLDSNKLGFRPNPLFIDSDADGLPDKWEIDYGFDPTNPLDALKDPDYDGLTNVQEYQLGTITKDGVLSHHKDLFVEIDYMSGYEPSTTVIDYLVSYYRELNIYVHAIVDDKISWNQLTAIGVSPDYLTSNECYLVEQNFHDNPATHVYVFYARALQDSDGSEPLGWASEFGAFIHKGLVNVNESLKVLWLTDRIRTERVVLLHEVGHTLGVIIRNSAGKEDYCNKWGCIMAGIDVWWDIFGGISQLAAFFSNTPFTAKIMRH